jgi:hypothetical protein
MKNLLRSCYAIAVVTWLVPSSSFAASDELPGVWHPHSFGMAILATVIFGLVGIILALVGFKMFDAITPFNLEREMCENKNVAVGILCAGIVVGVCLIVAASIV